MDPAGPRELQRVPPRTSTASWRGEPAGACRALRSRSGGPADCHRERVEGRITTTYEDTGRQKSLTNQSGKSTNCGYDATGRKFRTVHAKVQVNKLA